VKRNNNEVDRKEERYEEGLFRLCIYLGIAFVLLLGLLCKW